MANTIFKKLTFFLKIISLVTIFVPIQINVIYAQTPPYSHYKASDGLASATVFEIIQDNEGFIWLATQHGVNRFDGKRFSTFRIENGLNSNMIPALALGNKGEIFFANYEKGINVYKNGEIKNYFISKTGKFPFITFMINVQTETGENKLYTNTRGFFVDVIKTNDSNKILESKIPFEIFTLNKIVALADGKVIALTTKGIFEIKNDIPHKINLEKNPNVEAYSLADGGDSSFFIGSKGNIFRIKNKKVIDNYKINVSSNSEVSNLLRDRKGNLWFSIMNKGFFKIPYGSKEIIDIGNKMDLQRTNINDLFEDREGNIWVGTYGKGVYCLNNFFLSGYSEHDGLSNNSIHSIVKDNSGRIFIGTFNGVNLLEKGKFEQIKKDVKSPLTEYIHNIKIIDNDVFIAGGFPDFDRGKINYKGINLYFYNRQNFIRTKSGLNIFATNGNSLLIDRDFFVPKLGFQNFTLFGESPTTNRVNDLLEDSQGNIWVGATSGLCKLSNLTEIDGKVNWDKAFFPNNSILNSKIRSIYQDKNNTVWFAGDLGIANYNLLDNSIKEFQKVENNDFSFSTSIISDKKGRMWIGTMRGLYLWDEKEINFLNSKSGLPSDEVLTLYYDEEKNILYTGTSSGITLLDINLFDEFPLNPPEIKLISIKSGNTIYSNNKELIFESDSNNIKIEFAALNFSSPEAVKYKYKLNNEWIETNYNFLNFSSLKYGKYKIEVAAKAQNTGWSENLTISFTILPRFYETAWFVIIIFSFIISLVLAIVFWRINLLSKKNREKLELTERINDLKHQALSSMMNPHFIFNSLNAVQYLINHQKNEEANDYIAMMAKLIRKNLETSGNGFILLSEEIYRLRLYLNLEKLRFSDKFSYEIITGSDVISDSLFIPNMIIQPFVENSLWHGILNSNTIGKLVVSFRFEKIEVDSIVSKSLIIKVTDNGVGIKEAKKKKKEDHISKGIQIIEERLKLLSTKMELPNPIILEDLSERNQNSQGTEVMISLSPPLYKIMSNN